MPALPPIMGPCVEQLLAISRQAVARAVDHACSALQDEARRCDSARRQELAIAAQDLSQQRAALSAAIGPALRNAITSPPAASRGVRLNPSSLTLVDDTEVVQSIESSRLAMQLDALVDKPLAELDRYVSSALGLEGIQPEDNPLRPAVFAHALRQAINECGAPAGAPALWMRHMADPLAAELVAAYGACVQILSRAGVRAAQYRVVTVPAPLARSASAPMPVDREGPASRSGVVPLRPTAGAAPRANISSWIELATQAIGGAALREFLFGTTAHGQQPLAPAYYRHVDEELAALEARWDEAPPDPQRAREYQHLPAVDRPVRAVGTETSLNRETWGSFGAPRQRSLVRTRLRKQAQHVGQAMGIDLVRQLVDQVAQDPRLLAPVREAMVALEPSLARLAVHAPRFFGEQDHPARLLLENIAQRSFKYNDEFSTEFREFFDGVTRGVNALNRLDTLADAAPFEQALEDFRAVWAQHDEGELRERQKVLDAVQLAERRQAEADRIAWELSQRSDMEGAPAAVQDFLYGTWSLVVAHARVQGHGGDMDPGGYIRVIADLLWSVDRRATLRDPARAFEIIPKLLPVLRSGLDLLGHPPAETGSFFQALERLHRPVLKLRARHRKQSILPEAELPPLDDDLKPAPVQKPPVHEEFWMRDGELRACGFEDTLPSDYAALEPEAKAGARVTIPVARLAGSPLPAAQADALIASFAKGSWVDLFSRQRWRRAHLTWVSSRRTLFMFVSHGGRPHSMTRRTLQRLMIDRLLRPVDAHEVVQHALDAVVQEHSQPMAA